VLAVALSARLPAAAGEPPAPALPLATATELKAAMKPQGKPRLVHLWATWCKPCVAEMPELAAALREMSALDVLLVSLDEPAKSEKAAKLLADAGGTPGVSLLAPPPRVYSAMRSVDPDWEGAVPTTLLFDGKGRLVHAQRGSTKLPLLRQELAKLAVGGQKQTPPPE